MPPNGIAKLHFGGRRACPTKRQERWTSTASRSWTQPWRPATPSRHDGLGPAAEARVPRRRSRRRHAGHSGRGAAAHPDHTGQLPSALQAPSPLTSAVGGFELRQEFAQQGMSACTNPIILVVWSPNPAKQPNSPSAKRFSDVTGLCHRSVFRFLPRKACEFQPAKLVTACHRFVTARFWVQKCKTGPCSRVPESQGFLRPDSPPRTRLGARQPSLSPLMSPLRPAPFLVQKALKTVESEDRFFRVGRDGMPELKFCSFSRKQAPDNHFAQDSAFGPENRRIPARRGCHRLSPLRHRAEKCAKAVSERTRFLEFELIMEHGQG